MTPLEWYFEQDFPRAGKYDLPRLERQDVELDSLKLLRFSSAIKNESENIEATVHFFENDDRFDEVWKNPDKYLDELSQYRQVLTPDFSLTSSMPITQQLLNAFRSRWCGWYWQNNGLTVIPTVNWGAPESFEFCFDGIPQAATVAVSTVGSRTDESGFMHGYRELIRRCEPINVICYGAPFPEMSALANVIVVPYSRTTHLTERLA